MAELGEPAAAAGACPCWTQRNIARPSDGSDGKKIPPWRNPDVWTQPGFGAPRGDGGPGRGAGARASEEATTTEAIVAATTNTTHQPSRNSSNSIRATIRRRQRGGGEEGQKDYSAELAAYYAAQRAAGRRVGTAQQQQRRCRGRSGLHEGMGGILQKCSGARLRTGLRMAWSGLKVGFLLGAALFVGRHGLADWAGMRHCNLVLHYTMSKAKSRDL